MANVPPMTQIRQVLVPLVGGLLVASASLAQADQLVPLHSQDVHAVVHGAYTSVQVAGDVSTITLRPGRAFSVVAHEEWNLYQPTLSVQVAHGVLTVTADCSHQTEAGPVEVDATDLANDCTDDLLVTLPPGVPVRATTGSGAVTSTGLRQAQALHSDAGDVTVTGAQGALVSATTANGAVRVAGVRAGVLEARSDAGDVTLTDVRAGSRVDVTSDNGALRLDRVQAPAVSASSNSGDVSARALRAGVVLLRTATGTVTGSLDAAPLSVTALSGNGDIALTLPSGHYLLRADSSTGTVQTTGLVDDPRAGRSVTAHTDGGNVRLTGRP